MLADWYFCSCVKADPDKTAIFLQILGCLSDASRNPEAARIALGELQRLDTWMQAYALQAVLRTFNRQGPPRELHSELDRYFSDLGEVLPEKLTGAFDELKSALLLSQGTRVTSNSFRRYLALLETPGIGTGSRIPYLDLRDFLPETIFFATLAHCIENDESYSALLQDTNESASILEILDAALHHRLGRLAFRCALTIARIGSRRYGSSQLEEAIWANPSSNPMHEPDLLSSWAELIDWTSHGDLGVVTDAVVLESLTLARLRNRLERKQGQTRLVSPLLPKESNELSVALSSVLWQSVLWHYALKLSPDHSAGHMAFFWRAPAARIESTIVVKAPYSEAKCQQLERSLLPFLRLREERVLSLYRVRVRVSPADRIELSDSAWLVFSPWVQLNANREVLKKKSRDYPRYPSVEHTPTLVRLLAASHLAGQLLLSLPADHPERPRFAALLVHAADVLEAIALPSGVPGQRVVGSHPALSTPYFGLAIFMRRHLEQLGSCQDERVAPRDFLTPPAGAGNGSVDLKSEPALYERTILPSVLISWVTTAFLSATRSSPSVRWLPMIDELYERQSNQDLWHHKLRAELMVRFLASQIPRRRERDFSWQRSLERPGQLLWQRQILASPADLREVDWNRNDLDAAAADGSTRLAIAIERLAALKVPSELPSQVVERWRRDWADQLGAVNDAKVLDRFLRLRLLELFAAPILRDDHLGRELIALTVLEYGSTFDLERLFEQLYPKDESAWHGPTDRVTQDLRLTLLYPLERIIANETGDGARRLVPQDVYLALGVVQRACLIQETLKRIAYFHRPAANGAQHNPRISRVLQVLLHQTSPREAGSLRLVEAEAASQGRGRLTFLPSDAEQIADWQIRAVVLDANLSRVKLLVEDLDTAGLYDLFALPEEEVEAFLAQTEAAAVVATVVICQPSTHDNLKSTTLFHCGLEYYIDATIPQRFERGDIVSLPVFRPASQERLAYDSTGNHRVQSLHTALFPGDVGELRLRERRTGHQIASSLTLRGPLITAEALAATWCGNPAWLFRPGLGESLDTEKKVFARLVPGPFWRPLEGNFLNLLLSRSAFGPDGLAVLAWVGMGNDDFSWRFALCPGEEYALAAGDFAQGDAEELAEEIERQGALPGLLVSLTAETIDGTIRLRLARRLPEKPECYANYPGLEVPFDRRNILWSKMVRPGDNLIAQRKGNRWLVLLSDCPAGFPSSAQVSWQGVRPKWDEDEIEVTVLAWDIWTAQIKGEVVQTRQLRLAPNQTRETFVPDWLGLQRGTVVHLKRALQPIPEKGDLLCLTVNDIAVFVEPESISMCLLSEEEPLAFATPRRGELIEDPWERPVSLVLDIAAVPRQVRDGGITEGVLVETPQRTSRGESLCEIWWQLGKSVVENRLQIDNLSRLAKVRVGARIRLDAGPNSWTCEAYPFRGKVRALWTVEKWARTTPGLTYLGIAETADGMLPLAELHPGRLVVLPAQIGVHRHLAYGDGQSFHGGLAPEHRARVHMVPMERGSFRRVTLAFIEGCLPGVARIDRAADHALVSQVRYRFERHRDEYVDVRRLFVLTQEQRRRADSLHEKGHFQAELDRYFESPRDLYAELAADRLTVRLHDLRVPGVNGDWVRTVPLGEDELPFVNPASYSADHARVRLFKDLQGGRVFASFRRVPAMTVNEFRIELGMPNLGNLVSLDYPLFYDGPIRNGLRVEDGDSGGDGGNGQEVIHRFEWGYGYALVSPESQLRFTNGPFKNARSTLFYGDKINRLTFLEDLSALDESVGDTKEDQVVGHGPDDLPSPRLILSIDEVQLEFSDATSLYRQGKFFRIVHLLNLQERPDGSIKIQSIIGMEEQSTESQHRPFRVDRAVLDTASEEKLSRRKKTLASSTDEPSEALGASSVILARLDIEKFRLSFGSKVIFRHVRMSFQQGPEYVGQPIEGGALVFMRVKQVVEIRNDLALKLQPFKGLDPYDVGEDCSDILLLRRRFSVREDLLPRIYEADQGDSLRDSVYLVQLTRPRSRVVAALWWNEDRRDGRTLQRQRGVPRIPFRKVSALRRATSRDIVLASVVKADGYVLQVELKPGVFVALKEQNISTLPDDLREGSVVRIDRTGETCFGITRALQGEEWYVPASGRPAVALPLNPMLDEASLTGWDSDSSEAWAKTGLFSIGGLPSILAMPGRYDEQLQDWSEPVPEAFINLMRSPHPKIVLTGRDRAGRSRLQPALESIAVGSLSMGHGDLGVLFVPKSRALMDVRALRWELLSFADEPITDMAARIAGGGWRYHDSETGSWLESGGVQRSQLTQRHTAITGPLFFEAHENQLHLRYTNSSLPNYGFPVRELVRTLSLQKETWLTVAGLFPEGGLWIEISPGRVAALPASVMVLPIDGREQSLSHFHWAAFSPGDKICLGLYSNDPSTIDRIAFENWRPGPRGAFGRRAILPVLEFDAERGSCRVGGGEFHLTLPVRWQEKAPRVLSVSSSNRITEFGDRLPEPGETVLLGIDANGAPSVLGLPELVPLPEARRLTSWELDPLESDVAALNLPSPQRAAQLAHTIEAAGGALPVTVELVTRDNVLYYSRRIQRSSSILPKGVVSIGRVAGLMRDQKTLLIRSGSGLLKAALERIVFGLPRNLYSQAVRALRESQRAVWVHASNGGVLLEGGLGIEPKSQADDIRVKLIEVIEGGQQAHSLGLICSATASQALYWLPAKDVGWTALSREELVVLAEHRSYKRAKLIQLQDRDVHFVSLTRLPEISKEFLALGVGKQLAVKILRRRGREDATPVRYLAETMSSGIPLEVESSTGQILDTSQSVLVEVVRRDTDQWGQAIVLTVPVGERKFTLDLPSFILNGTPMALRPGFRDFLLWMTERVEMPALNTSPPREMRDPDLIRKLCHVWRLPIRGREALTVLKWQVGLSNMWWRKNASQPEIELPYALMSLLLLDHAIKLGAKSIAAMGKRLSIDDLDAFVAEWREVTRDLFYDIYHRALRSIHVEIIWQEWLISDEASPTVGDLRQRLKNLQLKSSLESEEFGAFLHFCRAVEMRQKIPGYNLLLPIMDAIRRATGQIELTKAMSEKSEILQGIIDLGRALPSSQSGRFPGLLGSHIKSLRTMLDKIVGQRLDIVLLGPLSGQNLQPGNASTRQR